MAETRQHTPARLFKANGRLYVTVATEMAEHLRLYLRLQNIDATPPDPASGEYVTLRIEENLGEDVVQPIIDDWNRDVYGVSGEAETSSGEAAHDGGG